MIDQTYQLLPDLDPEQFEALVADIRQRGVLVPIEKDESGKILDGHQRLRAVTQIEEEDHRKVPYQVVVRAGLSEDDKFAHGLSLNGQRRQLTNMQKFEVAVEVRQRFGWSTPKIGRLLGVHQSTVVRWLQDIPGPEHVLGDDGRFYKAQVWGGITTDHRSEAVALEAAISLGGRAQTVNLKRALVLVRQQNLRGYQEVPGKETRGEVELRVGPLHQALADLEPDSVDLILTDPPYPQEFLEAWSDLGTFAERVLRPGRLLIAYTGHRWLDECFHRLEDSGLNYAWLGSLMFGGNSPSVHDRHVFSGWRPMLWFSKGEWQPPLWSHDSFTGEAREKELHPWQQALGTFLSLIEDHSLVNELVVDPFLGSGTTAVAAVQTNRRFIGCDIDPGAVGVTRERLGF